MHKRILLILLVVSSVWFISIGTAQQANEQTLIVGISADPITLDPHDSTAMNDRNYYYQLFDTP